MYMVMSHPIISQGENSTSIAQSCSESRVGACEVVRDMFRGCTGARLAVEVDHVKHQAAMLWWVECAPLWNRCFGPVLNKDSPFSTLCWLEKQSSW